MLIILRLWSLFKFLSKPFHKQHHNYSPPTPAQMWQVQCTVLCGWALQQHTVTQYMCAMATRWVSQGTHLITWKASTATVHSKCSIPQTPREHLPRWKALQTGVKTRITSPCLQGPTSVGYLPLYSMSLALACLANKQTLCNLMIYIILLTWRDLRHIERETRFRASALITGPQWFLPQPQNEGQAEFARVWF